MSLETSHDKIDITVDSGAGASACHPKHFPESVVVDSPGSLAGQVFAGPGGEKILNEGQLKADMVLENGAEGKFTFQTADLRSPLLAVSAVNDKGIWSCLTPRARSSSQRTTLPSSPR